MWDSSSDSKNLKMKIYNEIFIMALMEFWHCFLRDYNGGPPTANEPRTPVPTMSLNYLFHNYFLFFKCLNAITIPTQNPVYV